MDHKKQSKNRKTSATGRAGSRSWLLDQEKGSYLKKWTGRLPVALLYPNTYRVGMSSLGFQLVYNLLNEDDRIVCERIFLPEKAEKPVSVESGRPIDNFPLLFYSISFEHDYVNLVKLLVSADVEPYAECRSDIIEPGNPLVICGGVATFMNPEPLAPFIDLFVVGEAEPLLPPLLELLHETDNFGSRSRLLQLLNRDLEGYYAPRFYTPLYDAQDRLKAIRPAADMPVRIKKIVLQPGAAVGHSELLTSETEFADLYLTELGRGCTRGCRFCTAGFIYRPPRMWDKEAVLHSLRQRPEGIERIGLLGMEMTGEDSLEEIADEITKTGCSLSFSSLRADKISPKVIELLSQSGLKSIAIAPDGASERLRKVINKGLNEEDLLDAARKLTEAGLYKLKLYLMIGLPTEEEDDLAEFLVLLRKIRETINPIGQKRGRLCEVIISVNSFVPKPWTPFQYHPYGAGITSESEGGISVDDAVASLRRKIAYLKKGVAGQANMRISFDNPEHVLFQAILSRGDRRLAPILLDMAASGISWKQSMKRHGVAGEYFATCQYTNATYLPWYIIDHSINEDYLWKEYLKSFDSKLTVPCDTKICRRCGVCHD